MSGGVGGSRCAIAVTRPDPRPMSGRAGVTWASRPTPLIPFRVFSRVSRAPFLRPSVRLLFLHWLPVGDGFPGAKQDASPTWTSRNLRARHSSLQARRRRVLCGCGYAAVWASVHFLFPLGTLYFYVAFTRDFASFQPKFRNLESSSS